MYYIYGKRCAAEHTVVVQNKPMKLYAPVPTVRPMIRSAEGDY